MFKYTLLWKMQNGKHIKITDMTDEHLTNTIRFVKRIGFFEKHQEELALVEGLSMVSGDGAFDAVESEIYALERETLHDWCMRKHRIYKSLVTEEKRRKKIPKSSEKLLTYWKEVYNGRR